MILTATIKLLPITIKFEGGYEYKINYYYKYGYPTYGASLSCRLWC
jgi:hypothetical protein